MEWWENFVGWLFSDIGQAAAIATAIATVITGFLMIWFRLIDSPKPRWALIPQGQLWGEDNSERRYPEYSFVIANVGTGSASLVSLVGFYCAIQENNSTENFASTHFSMLEPGSTMQLKAQTSSSKWNHVRVLVTWTEPTRLRIGRKFRHKVFKLDQYFDAPQLVFVSQVSEYEYEYSPIERTNSEREESILQSEKLFEVSGNVAIPRSNWMTRYFHYRKLRRKGWSWVRHNAREVKVRAKSGS